MQYWMRSSFSSSLRAIEWEVTKSTLKSYAWKYPHSQCWHYCRSPWWCQYLEGRRRPHYGETRWPNHSESLHSAAFRALAHESDSPHCWTTFAFCFSPVDRREPWLHCCWTNSCAFGILEQHVFVHVNWSIEDLVEISNCRRNSIFDVFLPWWEMVKLLIVK